VLAPLPPITKAADVSGGGGGVDSSSSSSWLAAAAIYPSGKGAGKLRAMLRPAPSPRNASGAPGGLFGDVGFGGGVDRRGRLFRGGGSGGDGNGWGGVLGGIVGIPWAHLSDLVVPSAASLAAEEEGDVEAEPATWTPAQPSRVPTGGGGLAAVPLADGRLLVLHHAVFGSDGRHVLAASVSRDGGGVATPLPVPGVRLVTWTTILAVII
jgi:hypothetical protein